MFLFFIKPLSVKIVEKIFQSFKSNKYLILNILIVERLLNCYILRLSCLFLQEENPKIKYNGQKPSKDVKMNIAAKIKRIIATVPVIT
jgi:hypothetical protein